MGKHSEEWWEKKRAWIAARYFDDKWTLERIAGDLELARSTLACRMVRWGWKPRSRRYPASFWEPRKGAMWVLYYERGWSIREVAAKHGVSMDTLLKQFIRWGWGRRGRYDRTPYQKEKARRHRLSPACQRGLRRHAIVRQAWWRHRRGRILSQLQGGLSIKAVAEDLGVKRTCLVAYLPKLGIHRKVVWIDVDSEREAG